MNKNNKKRIFCFIFARGGSKQIKNKNLETFKGKPLLYYSINLAKKIKYINKIFVSTDDKRIAAYAKKYGVNIINRPKNLALDNSPEIMSWKHAVKYLSKKNILFDTFLSLPTTSPLRNKADVVETIKKLKGKTDIVLTASPAKKNPWFNMVIRKNSGFYKVINSQKKIIFNRQKAPKVYDLTTVAYVTTPSFVLKANSYFDGNVDINKIPSERSIDIDSYQDLRYANFLGKPKY